MAVEGTSSVLETPGDGSNQEFDFGFKILLSTDLIVRLKNTITGVYGAPLTDGVDYLLTFDSDAETGTVNMTVAPTSAQAVNMARSTTLTQPDTLPRESVVVEKTIESMVDRNMLAIQELANRLTAAGVPSPSPMTSVYYAGVLANRPANPTVWEWWYATDNGQLYLYVLPAAQWFLMGGVPA